MQKTIFSIGLVFVFIFTGCAKQGAVAYDAQGYKRIKQVQIGKIIDVRDVYIKDDGTGTIVGAIIGTVLGSTIGKGDGSTLASLGGAIVGSVAGSKINEKNVQELTVTLKDDEIVVIISKGTNLRVGDKIRIITDDDEVASVRKIGD